MMERIWSRGDAAEYLKGFAFLLGYLEGLPAEVRGRMAADLRAIARVVEDEDPGPAAEAPPGTTPNEVRP